MNTMKVCGPRPTPEAMQKRLGGTFAEVIPALEDRGTYLLEVWIRPLAYPLIEVVRDGEGVRQVEVPAVGCYHLRRDGRIGLCPVARPLYRFRHAETQEPLAVRP